MRDVPGVLNRRHMTHVVTPKTRLCLASETIRVRLQMPSALYSTQASFRLWLGGDCSIMLGCLLCLKRRGRYSSRLDTFCPSVPPPGALAENGRQRQIGADPTTRLATYAARPVSARMGEFDPRSTPASRFCLAPPFFSAKCPLHSLQSGGAVKALSQLEIGRSYVAESPGCTTTNTVVSCPG